ncbi:DUF397 domain-containing protein [Streptomyces mayteni]
MTERPLTRAALDAAGWVKSSRSGPNGNECVEVAQCQGWTGIRDSKEPKGPVLTAPAGAFAALLAHLVAD